MNIQKWVIQAVLIPKLQRNSNDTGFNRDSKYSNIQSKLDFKYSIMYEMS